MNEAAYQRKLIRAINKAFPGCIVLKNDPADNQGIPDLLILFQDKWAMLEVKVSSSASEQPNQDYYVNRYNEMSFAAFIHPEIEEQVLDDLQRVMGSCKNYRT